MGISPRFRMQEFMAALERDLQKIEKAIILRLIYLGELCVNYARSLNTYVDQTGNLRASIGYVVVRDRHVVKKNFRSAQTGANARKGTTGEKEGEALALSVADELPARGFGLIVVAGMHYALYVESKGYDVLSSSELLAKNELHKQMRKLMEQIRRMQ